MMTKRGYWTLGLGLLLVGCGQGALVTPRETTLSSQALPSGAAVCFYEGFNYQGASFCASTDHAWVGGRWNDRVSSVKVAPGYRAEMFYDADYSGGFVAVEADSPNLAQRFFDRQMSSFRICKIGGTAPDTTAPTVSNVVSSSSLINTTDPVTLSADASDNVGVSRVEFYAGDLKIGEATAAPYTAVFAPASIPNGPYYFYAKAFDAAGNSSAATTGRTLNIAIPR